MSESNGIGLRWYTVVVDCHDVHAQARWWGQVLDWQLVYEADDEAVIVPRHATADPVPGAEWGRQGPGLVFVPVPEGKTVKNRLHIDLAPHLEDDRDAQIERLVGLGASLVDVGQDDAEVSWTVLADPEGNEFCVLSSREM
ncbi:VOC family protein [Alteromonas gracilis]